MTAASTEGGGRRQAAPSSGPSRPGLPRRGRLEHRDPVIRRGDAFGHALFDAVSGAAHAHEIIERSDGFVAPGAGPGTYLSAPRDWPRHEREAIRFARGRVLDVGCGAGRHALYLQRRGHDVVAIDVSRLAVEAAKRRGVRRARVMGIEDLPGRLGRFDTVLLLGANFGLLQSRAKAPRLLAKLARSTNPGARIVATTLDPYRTSDPRHRAYHRANRRRGRLGGQVRIRVRYRDLATPWFDYLFVSRAEMRALLAGTGWRVARFIASGGPQYAAIIERSR